MKDGEKFFIKEHTTPETHDKFLNNFYRFASFNNSDYNQWTYDDTTDCIQYFQTVKLKNALHPRLKDMPVKPKKTWGNYDI